MNKFLVSAAVLISTAFSLSAFTDAHNLNILIKQLHLKTSRAEFIDTPTLLQNIINELYTIQNELQSLSLFTHDALQNLSQASQNFNTISEQLSAIIPQSQLSITITPKVKTPRTKTSLSRTLKVLEKNQIILTKNIKNLNLVNKILEATLQELEVLQQEIYNLGLTVKQLALAYHTQAKDLFLIALKLFTLTGIESETGPYLGEVLSI
jgi:hypothetical protein